MSFTRYASFDVDQILDIKGTDTRQRTASLDKISEFDDFKLKDKNFMYVRIRAISSRCNANNDGWPSIELAGDHEVFERHKHQSSDSGFVIEASEIKGNHGFFTFLGKPIFVDHNNSNPKRARGVIVDSKLRVLDSKTAAEDKYWGSKDVDPEHLPATEIELLLEVDAKEFPKFAKAILDGDLDGFSMGADVEKSTCNICSNVATNADEFCSHIIMKGAEHDYRTASGERKSKKSYENVSGIKFFEISGVFEPADNTALTKEVISSIIKEGENGGENPLPQSMHVTAPEEVDTLRKQRCCPICGEDCDEETCSVCGYCFPPEGFGNPDLNKAQEIKEKMKEGDDEAIEDPQDQSTAPGEAAGNQGQPQGPGQPKQEGSWLGGPSKASSTINLIDMRWQPLLDPKVAGRINKIEVPNRPVSKPATNEPKETIISDPGRPITSAMITAKTLIEATKQRGDTMSTRTADGTTAPGAAPNKRVDVTGVGGVIQDSNDAASAADKQISPTGMGGTGVEGVEPDSTQKLQTAPEGSDDSGFNTDKNTGDSGETSTWSGDKRQTDPVTSKPFPDTSRGASRFAYEDGRGDIQDFGGGTAVQGVQPIDSIGKADKRVNVLEHTTTPANNSGKTDTWHGTDGNGVNKQQDPVTKEVTKSDGITSKIAAIIRLADVEVDMGLIGRDDKWSRFAQLENETEETIVAQLHALARVKTAGLTKNASNSSGGSIGVKRLPSFRNVKSSIDVPEPEVVDQTSFDSALFA